MPNIENDRPHFELRQIPHEGQPGPVEIYHLDQMPAQMATLHLGRRELLALAGLTSGVLFAAACTPATPTPVPARQTSAPAATKLPERTSTSAATVAVTARPTGTSTRPAPTPANSQTAQAVMDRSLSCGELNATGNKVGFLAFTPDSSLMAVKDVGQQVRLWKVDTGELLHTFSVEADAYGIGFSADGKLLAVGNKNGVIFIWRVADYKEYARVETRENSPRDIFFTPDNKTILVSSLKKIQIWALAPVAKVSEIAIDNSQPAALSPDGKLLAYANPQPKGGVYDILLKSSLDGPVLRSLQGSTNSITWLSFSPDSQMLAATGTGTDSAIFVWRVTDSKPLFSVPHKPVWWVGFSPDSKLLGAYGTSFLLYSSADGKMIREEAMDKRWDFGVPNPGLNLIARVKENRISIWNINTPANDLGVCLFDPNATAKDSSAVTFKQTDASGITRTYTLPCGSAVPAGAVCTCNCIPGLQVNQPTQKMPTATCTCVSNVGGGSCSCNKICTCIPVRKYCFVMFKPEQRA